MGIIREGEDAVYCSCCNQLGMWTKEGDCECKVVIPARVIGYGPDKPAHDDPAAKFIPDQFCMTHRRGWWITFIACKPPGHKGSLD